MANLIYDLIDPAELLNYVRAYDNEVLRPQNQFKLGKWLPDELTEDLEFRVRKGTLIDQDAAEYRAFDTTAPMTDREGVSYISGSLGPVSRQIPLGEEESLRLRALERGSNEPLVAAIYDDAERMARAVRVRLELARGDVFDDGAVTIAENGLSLTADFGRASLMRKTAATVWTNPAATILSELLAWQTDYVDHNGVEPGSLMMPRTRLPNLALNTEMRSYAAANGTTPTRLNAAAINDVFASEGLPPIEFYDVSVRVNKVATRVLPVNKVYFTPPVGERYGKTFFGPTAEAIKLRERGMIDREEATGLVVVIAQNDHPVQTFTIGTAIAVPGTPNPDLVLDAVVA